MNNRTGEKKGSVDILDDELGSTDTPPANYKGTELRDLKHMHFNQSAEVVENTFQHAQRSRYGDLKVMEKEEAEQETLQDLNPELGEVNLAMDMPILERSMSLALQDSHDTRPAKPRVSEKNKAQRKALEEFSYLSRKLPFTGYNKAVMIAEGRYVLEKDENGKVKLYDQSLTMALFHTVKFRMMLAVGCKIISSIITQTSSLVTKQLILFITARHAYAKLTDAEKALSAAPPSIGKGIGLAIALTCMQEIASICNNHYVSRCCGSPPT